MNGAVRFRFAAHIWLTAALVASASPLCLPLCLAPHTRAHARSGGGRWLAMIIVTRYVVEPAEPPGTYRVRALAAPFCPVCGSLCSGYDSRPRRAVGDDGIVTIYRLRRVRCPSCGALHVELPDFMRPGKHYAAAVIDGVLSGHGECCPAEGSTMWRWRRDNRPPGLQCFSVGEEVGLRHSNTKEDNDEEG